MTLIAKNQTAGALPLSQLPVPDNEIPASGQVTLTDYAVLNEIQADAELLAHITAGDCILNDGSQDLTQAQSLASASTVMATQSGTALMEAVVDAKGDLLAATAADTVDRLAVGTDTFVLTADSTEPTGVKWAAASGSGTLDHAALTSNLTWTTSGHTGAASNLAGFTAGGAADELTATEARTLLNVEDGADITDATNVAAAGAVMEALADAKGDLFVATGADAIARLPVGANRQILRADSTQAEGVIWISEELAVYADYYDAGTTNVGTSPTTLGLDTSRQSNSAFVLSSDTVTVQAGGGGDYFIRYDVTFGETDSSNRECECWMEINGTEVPATRSVFSHWDEHGLITDNTAGRSAIVTLADSDVVRLRGDVTNGSSGYTTDTGGVSLQIMSIGANGPAGPQGPAGSGSTINIEEDGAAVSGGPHDTLNFIGMEATDAGSGTAGVKNVYGSEYQSVVDRTYRSVTSTSWFTAHTFTTSSLPAGTYRIEWNYVWSYNASNTDFRCRVQLDNSIELYEQTDGGAGAYDRHQQEPKDRDGTGDGGTDQRYVTSFWADKTLSAGTHQVDIDISGQGGAVTASIHLSSIAVYRVS
jgi:hypothetical protein